MAWHHISTHYNPSDILSRGCTPLELLDSTLWREGPPFLRTDEACWPPHTPTLVDVPERRRLALVLTQSQDISYGCKFQNCFGKLQRVFGYIHRFLMLKAKDEPRRRGPLTVDDIKGGTHLLIKGIQLINFAEEYKALQSKRQISSKSKLYSLHPICDESGLIRVGGRLQNSLLDYGAKHPILLPKDHPVTSATIAHYHLKFLHSGPQSLLAALRQRFWPIGGRKIVAATINKCIRCFRLKPKLAEHIMAPLPSNRVQPSRPFVTVGIDFCGPFYSKSEVRNRPPVKCYIAIFVCFATKACHLELVEDLSAASFIAALKRFISLRGKPGTIWSDNATNFVGAKNDLLELRQLFLADPQNSDLQQAFVSIGIKWQFIPPRSPHFGGLWEAAVKSAKYHFHRVVGNTILSFNELRTLVYEISAILNSRPLCPISENPNDLDVLTPGHFLIGSSFATIEEPDITHLSIDRLSRWQRVCQIQQIIWRKWSTSYLSLLQERGKWRASRPNILPHSIVVLKEDNIPPLQWRLGRVESIIHGADGVARVAVIRTATGLIKRAVGKIAVLPLETTSSGSVPHPAGEHVGSRSSRFNISMF
ncbi:uncharacterized protein LOC110187736 [Drosophila serrata]|uniref:uncharacterized protein LOC110187736 n=1 Tax=Drosophila serrata TaxID=7274 RepID=UPI000A1D10BF|nr:uncharacterized protein LOC110187736 [Drosophila serrata]